MLGAKAASVQLAVPPTLAAGDWSVDSEGDGEESSGDLHDGVSGSDNSNLILPRRVVRGRERVAPTASNQVKFHFIPLPLILHSIRYNRLFVRRALN